METVEVKMSQEQAIFYAAKMALDQFDAIERMRPLTVHENQQRDMVYDRVLGAIMRYGTSLARQRLEKYRKPNDAYADIRQDMALMVLEHLRDYDPARARPTTYFKPYFNECISNFCQDFSQNLSSYDAVNVARVRSAIKYFEGQGITWNEAMLITYTGLSAKVVRQTLVLAANSIWANVDEMVDLPAQQPTPEEAYLQSEKTATLYQAVKDTLTPDELTFFLYRLNLDGSSERTYQDVAEHFKLDIRDAKALWSEIILKLSDNPDMQAYRPHKHRAPPTQVALRNSTTISGKVFFTAYASATSDTPSASDEADD